VSAISDLGAHNDATIPTIDPRSPRPHCRHPRVSSRAADVRQRSVGALWRTRTKLSTEIFDWIEVFYNRTRRHSGLGMLDPIAYEKLHANDTSVA
jgi:transposase InsO family protein